jgi:TetR/AcrR family transcriptional repressor of nem operon
MARRKRSNTKAAIVKAAAELFHLHGVSATSVDDVLRASGTGKSQFYYYFDSKEALVHEVLAFQFERYIAAQQPFIDNLGSWKGINQWLDAIAERYEASGLLGGCPIGSLAAEMNDRDEALRQKLAESFDRWEAYLVEGLESLRQRKLLSPRANVAELAESVMAAIQGGYLLATTKKDIGSMRNTLRSAYSYLRSHKR